MAVGGLSILTVFAFYQQAQAGPITGGPGVAPFVKLGVYQGVISVVPGGVTGGVPDSIMEIGNAGRDIKTTGALNFFPASGSNVTVNETSGDANLELNPNGTNVSGFVGRYQVAVTNGTCASADNSNGNSYYTYLANGAYHLNCSNSPDQFWVENQFVHAQAITMNASQGIRFLFNDTPNASGSLPLTERMRVMSNGTMYIPTICFGAFGSTDCSNTWAGGGSGTVSGTINKLAKFTAATVVGNSAITETGGDVVVNGPDANFSVQADAGDNPVDMRFQGGSVAQPWRFIFPSSVNGAGLGVGANNFGIYNATAADYLALFRTNATVKLGFGTGLNILANGNVGISNSTPGGRLVVNNNLTGNGSAGDGLSVYVNTANSAIYSQQDNVNGYAGYFSNTAVGGYAAYFDGKVTINDRLNAAGGIILGNVVKFGWAIQVCGINGGACLGRYLGTVGSTTADLQYRYNNSSNTPTLTGLIYSSVANSCPNGFSYVARSLNTASYYLAAACSGGEFTNTATTPYGSGFTCVDDQEDFGVAASRRNSTGCVAVSQTITRAHFVTPPVTATTLNYELR